MKKINGYTFDEALRFVEYIQKGKRQNRSLSELFTEYASMSGRAKGSVRNYYYQLLRERDKNDAVARLLKGSQLTVGSVKPFTKQETDRLLNFVLVKKSEGASVRSAIHEYAAGDERLLLRYQNKYRNLVRKEPQAVVRRAKELNLEDKIKLPQRLGDRRLTLQRKIEEEINRLYDRLSEGIKEENESLKRINSVLRSENESLKRLANFGFNRSDGVNGGNACGGAAIPVS